MDTNSKDQADKIQDTSTTDQDKNTTEITWNLEEARKLAQELLKDFPLGNKKGSCIMPAPKRSQAEKRHDKDAAESDKKH